MDTLVDPDVARDEFVRPAELLDAGT